MFLLQYQEYVSLAWVSLMCFRLEQQNKTKLIKSLLFLLNINFIVWFIPDWDSNPRSTILEESTLTITPIFQLKLQNDTKNIKDIIHRNYQYYTLQLHYKIKNPT
jgi:hypothetical protein